MRSSHTFLFENQCRIRGEERRQSTFLVASFTLTVTLSSPSSSFLFFIFFLFIRVFLLIRTPCIAFINHSWHACVYNSVLCTCEYNNYINESISRGVCRAASSLTNNFSRQIIKDYTYYIRQKSRRKSNVTLLT